MEVHFPIFPSSYFKKQKGFLSKVMPPLNGYSDKSYILGITCGIVTPERLMIQIERKPTSP